MGQTVNLLLFSFSGSNPLAPTNAVDLLYEGFAAFLLLLFVRRSKSQNRPFMPKKRPLLSSKCRQIIPKESLNRSGLSCTYSLEVIFILA